MRSSSLHACYMPFPTHPPSDTVALPFTGSHRSCKQAEHIRASCPSTGVGARMHSIARWWWPLWRLIRSHQISIHRSLLCDSRASFYCFNWFNGAVRWWSIEWSDDQWIMNCKECGRRLSWLNLKYHSSIRRKGLTKTMTAAAGLSSESGVSRIRSKIIGNRSDRRFCRASRCSVTLSCLQVVRVQAPTRNMEIFIAVVLEFRVY
jgi:hypothetical protein